MTSSKSIYETLNKVDVSEWVKKKGKFDYVSWAHAWHALKKAYPSSFYVKKKFAEDLPYVIDSKGNAYVEVSVTVIDGDVSQEQSEVFPVLDMRNQSCKNPDSAQVNKALQRCLVKAVATHGLGLNIYAGEDLPSDDVQPVVSSPNGQANETSLAKGNRFKLKLLIKERQVPESQISRWLEHAKVSNIDELDLDKVNKLIALLEKK